MRAPNEGITCTTSSLPDKYQPPQNTGANLQIVYTEDIQPSRYPQREHRPPDYYMPGIISTNTGRIFIEREKLCDSLGNVYCPSTSNYVPFRLFHTAPLLETREDLKLFIVRHL